jgi:hypothetical protein
MRNVMRPASFGRFTCGGVSGGRGVSATVRRVLTRSGKRVITISRAQVVVPR